MTSLNIYEQQARNKRLTIVIMVLFILFLCFIGFGIDVQYQIMERTSLPLATLISVLVGTGSAFWSLQNGASTVLRSTGAMPANPNNPQHKLVLNLVEEMSIASGLPRPQVYIVPDDDPNAFATGKNPEKSYVAVTEGLLKTLNREELQGVIAHEMSHIRNYDIRLMTVVAALVGAIILLSDFSRRGMLYGRNSSSSRRSSSSKNNGGALGILVLALWLLSIILAPILARVMAMAISRKREYLADASAAELTRNPAALASALEKIENAVSPTQSIKTGSAHLCIADPIGSKLNEKEGFLSEIFGTHPPIKKRIAALKSMSYLS